MKIGNSLKAFFARIYGVRAEPVEAAPVAAPVPTPAPAPVRAAFSETNRLAGKTIRAGAFEFLAETPLGEVRGRLADPEREPQDGALLSISIPAKCIRIDETPPEENGFAGRVESCVPAGGRFELRFSTDSGVVLNILADEEPPSCEPDESVYAWFFPEDAVGFSIEK